MGSPLLRYRVDLTKPGHEVVVTATFDAPPRDGSAVRLYMPRWAPGSYLIREFARMVDWIRAEQDGKELAIRKSTTDGWTVDGARARPLVVRYGLHARDLSVRTNYLGTDRALLAGAATFIVPEGCESRPARVRVDVPKDWPLPECPLPLENGEFVARDFDQLVDSPIAAGPCQTAEFEARGVPHRIAVYGAGDTRLAELTREAKALAEVAADVFDGRIPCDSYLHVIELGCGGGLEHADSSVCGFPQLALATDAEWRRCQSLVAHEYFHLWNIKRIRPKGLGPFDYRREAHVQHLWVAEGLTSYYQHVLCLRAKLIDAGRFLATWAAYAFDAEASTGERFQSLEESSHDAWIKYYRQHEGSPNTQVSYYGKGALAGLVLDLEIRRRTKGRRSLDDAFRALWRHFKETGDGFDDALLRDALAEAAKERIDDVVDEVACRARPLDVDARLRMVGLEIDRRIGRFGGFLGITVRRSDGRLVVDRVLRDRPAWNARVAPGEEIVAFDGWRVDDAELRARVLATRPGDFVTLTTALAGRLREVRFPVGARPPQDYRVRKLATAGPVAKATLKSWLGKTWDELETLNEIHEELRPGGSPRPV